MHFYRSSFHPYFIGIYKGKTVKHIYEDKEKYEKYKKKWYVRDNNGNIVHQRWNDRKKCVEFV